MSLSQLPYSQSCENNKDPILAVLKQSFSQTRQVLEIGSGTGQHAVFFAQHLPHLTWYPSDQAEYLGPLSERIALQGGKNIHPPMALDVTAPWPLEQAEIDGIFSANTLHIMSQAMVVDFFKGVDRHLSDKGSLCVYGPFNYDNQYTSESNRQFDIWLKHRNIHSGIRDIEWITTLANEAGLSLIADHPMPANNRLLHFSR
ncbi:MULTISPECIES: DUF938 domain-containing protein [Shewanella]|uniref:DUF938 domain-containing protein n=1 Tax=Shewanella marisflavi TaxID=260364 RepID=A0ABX5WKQ0_9GAMM|nr:MULTISPECIES: DUF938 domain-containing protein [Shewanella]QDF75131.1 DUF938 domain-containing protein [Shewanella marisflavi]